MAKPRFEQGLYSDTIEAAIKGLNQLIKKEYIQLKDDELDGDKLMRHIFSTSNKNTFDPTVHLAYNSTENGIKY